MGASVVVFYLPTFIARLFGTAPDPTVGFVVATPWLGALAATYAVPKLAERTGRLVVSFGFASLLVAAAAIYRSSGSSQLLSIVATYLAVAGLWAVQPIFWTLLTDCLGWRGGCVWHCVCELPREYQEFLLAECQGLGRRVLRLRRGRPHAALRCRDVVRPAVANRFQEPPSEPCNLWTIPPPSLHGTDGLDSVLLPGWEFGFYPESAYN